ncbi:hypothetical protein GCM10011579_094800 [Streptomyces albiflavescens]|uniref:DUF2993 domain-containing protein n=1 Tax=Streptomyces albiflavescens TaxID=1623582 RepID=A0A918DB45_9ACTN|nr:DUF2993 domain-containing protein [Streptomyces albiflavescens]GGN94840.1 hypothetical protein GCM10011579_094800 [Streptomyces albiflavescens]
MPQPPYAYGDGDTYQSYEPYEPYEPPAPPRRRRPVFIAVAALLTLAVVPVVVDRVATARVEARTAKAFQQGMDTPERPEVHVRGFPVLTQLASGTLRHVDITAHDIPADGSARPLPLSELDLRLNGLRKSDNGQEARASSAEATAHLSYTDVSDALGIEVSQGTRPGQVGARVLLPFGDEVTVTTTVSAVSGNRIRFRNFQVTGGVLPTAGKALLDKVFEKPIQLRNIPEGLQLRSVTTTAHGLSARFSGESVTFHPDGASKTDLSQDNSSYRNA